MFSVRWTKHFNGIDPKDDTTFYQIGNRVYYTIMIVTTVGLGDITKLPSKSSSGLLLTGTPGYGVIRGRVACCDCGDASRRYDIVNISVND
jgi:hypothetical protein